MGINRVFIVRLADVIGPYDDSCRFWKYILWNQVSHISKIQLNTKDHLKQKLTFTFSQDVVNIIIAQLSKDEKNEGAFNIGCTESPTLEQFLKIIQGDENRFTYLDGN